MRDQMAADVQLRLNLEGFAGHDFGDKAVGRGKRVFQLLLADDLMVRGRNVHGFTGFGEWAGSIELVPGHEEALQATDAVCRWYRLITATHWGW
jgi:hypothetical protein